MKKHIRTQFFTFLVFTQMSWAQSLRLPDVMQTRSGKQVATAKEWFAVRRPEIVRLFTDQVYGVIPSAKDFDYSHQLIEKETPVLNGKAYRRQVRLTVTNAKNDTLPIDVMSYYPASAKRKPVPVFVFLNYGNHTLLTDSTVRPPVSSQRHPVHQSLQRERASYSRRFPIEDIINAGCGVVTACYDDFVPDLRTVFREVATGFYGLDPDSTGAVSLWAWGHSRLLDFALTQKVFDARRTGVVGHSRLGKTALWTAVNDERFRYAFVNESGNTGAKLSLHFTAKAESIEGINRVFPHWFRLGYKRYNGQDSLQSLPFDQHWLLAAVAPRRLYVASAEDDYWSDPEGEFLGLKEAQKVYRFLRKDTHLPARFPPAGTAVITRLCGYHIRKGNHDLLKEDWMNFCRFIKQ